MTKLTLIVISLILLAETVLAQNAKPKMKTIRLHIDGFQKSKSGAV